MSPLTIIILIFSILGALDKLFGNKLGLGKEFEKGFGLFLSMVFSMLGILVVAPALGEWLTPFFGWFYKIFKIDPSIIPASLFANDMGGTTLAKQVGVSESIRNFNAYIVSSMMGCVISFTISFAIGVVKKDKHKEMFLGILCGIITIPIGCIVAGLMCGIGFLNLTFNLLPLITFALILGIVLVLFRDFCIKAFFVFGHFIRCVGMIGLICGIFTFLTKIEINRYFDSFENAAFICVNASVTLSGALPLMFVISKILNKPLEKIGSKIGIDSVSAVSFLGTMVTNVTTFGIMEKMNKKGVVLNSAWAVSAAFALGGHMAFTMAFDSAYVVPMIVGKIISGIAAVGLAMVIYKEK